MAGAVRTADAPRTSSCRPGADAAVAVASARATTNAGEEYAARTRAPVPRPAVPDLLQDARAHPQAQAASRDADGYDVGTFNLLTLKDTLDKYVHCTDENNAAIYGTPDWFTQVGPDTLIVVDEAGMASTPGLDAMITHALAKGASVRLVGDDAQLASISAGGVLRDIATDTGALTLSEVVRFHSRAEAAASLSPPAISSPDSRVRWPPRSSGGNI